MHHDIENAIDVTFLDGVTLTGELTINATGAVDLGGAVQVSGGLITIDHTGAVTLGSSLTATGGNVTLNASIIIAGEVRIDAGSGDVTIGETGGYITGDGDANVRSSWMVVS